mgnify:CR=1 FL=1
MNRLFKPFVIYWSPILLYLGIILGLSSLSSLPFSLTPGMHLDKLLHFTEYFMLALLMARACAALPKPSSFMATWLLSSTLVLMVGCADECYQSLVPNRSSEWLDLLADGLGGMMGSALFLWIRQSWTSRVKESV